MLESNLWRVYLSGEIHSDWRNEIKSGIEQTALPVQLTAPVIDHAPHDVARRVDKDPHGAAEKRPAERRHHFHDRPAIGE